MRSRQVELDRGTLAELAVNFYVTARLLYEAVHLGKAEAGTMAYILGRKERIEGLSL